MHEIDLTNVGKNLSVIRPSVARIYSDEFGLWQPFREEIHEAIAILVLLLIVMHISGVLLSGHAHNENLLQSMLTGRKKAQ